MLPYAKVHPRPTSDNPVAKAFVDKDLGGEGVTYILGSGKEGTIHIEQVLEYNQDPNYLRDLLLYKLTIEAQERVLQTFGVGRTRASKKPPGLRPGGSLMGQIEN